MKKAEIQVHNVKIFVDEIRPAKNARGESWLYIGLLVVPTLFQGKALRQLQQDRDAVGYDGEIHFTELKNYSYAHEHFEKTLLARRWLQRVLDDDGWTYHFSLLGIDTARLDRDNFGRSKRVSRKAIYNRFFRSALLWSLGYFFANRPVEVRRLAHDMTEFQKDPWFRTAIANRLDDAKQPYELLEHRTQFVNSNHRQEPMYPKDSHFIQLCDLLLGAFTQVLDNRSRRKDGCNELAAAVYPLLQQLTDPSPAGQQAEARFNSHRRLAVSFFRARRPRRRQATMALRHPRFTSTDRCSGVRMPADGGGNEQKDRLEVVHCASGTVTNYHGAGHAGTGVRR